MATFNQVVEGLQILAKYEDGNEHDIIWAGRISPSLTEEEKKKLNDLGWHYDEDVERWGIFV
jgi:hypothetical protein